jgi:hypothetical protein
MVRSLALLVPKTSGQKGLGNHYFRVCQLPLEHGVWTILVRRDDEFVAVAFEIFAQAKLARHAAKKRARFEIDIVRRRNCLTTGIAFDPRYDITGVSRGISIDRVIL